MITRINSTDIRVEEIKRKTVRRVSQSAIAGTPDNPIDKLGWDGLTFKLKAYTLSERDFDDLMAELYEDDVELHVRIGWFYYATVVSLGGKFEESDVDYYPFDASFKTEEPFAYSEDLHTVSADITTNNQTFGGSNIQTYGNINAVPDIILIGGTDDTTIITQTITW